MCIHISQLLFLKCNENVIFFSKTNKNKVKGPFILKKCPFCYVMLGGCPDFLNKALDQVYSNKLKSCNSKGRKKYTLLHSITFSLQKLWPCSLSRTQTL